MILILIHVRGGVADKVGNHRRNTDHSVAAYWFINGSYQKLRVLVSFPWPKYQIYNILKLSYYRQTFNIKSHRGEGHFEIKQSPDTC